MLTIEIRDKDLVRRAVLDDGDLGGALVTPRQNAPGVWQVTLPETVGGVVHEVCWWLRQEGAGVIVHDDARVLLSGPCESRKRTLSATVPEGEWTFTGVSDLRVLAHEQAWPDPSQPVTAQTTRTNDVRTGAAESLLHAYVAANLGPASQRPRLLLGADLGRGATRTEAPRYESLLELCQRIAGSEVCFDVVQDGAGLRFITWEPADLTRQVQLDIELGGLSRCEVEQKAPSVTRAIVLGGGEGTARVVRVVTTPASLAAEAIYGARTVVIDQRQTSDLAELEQAGLDAIAEGMATTSTEAIPSDDAGLVGVRPGDWVTVVLGDTPEMVQLGEIPHRVGDVLLVGATIGEPLSGDQAVTAALAKRLARAEAGLRRLEREV